MVHDTIHILACVYDRFQDDAGRPVRVIKEYDNESDKLGNIVGKSLKECKDICSGMNNCWSFAFNPKQGFTTKCWFFAKILRGNESTYSGRKSKIFTVYKKCREMIIISVLKCYAKYKTACFL